MDHSGHAVLLRCGVQLAPGGPQVLVARSKSLQTCSPAELQLGEFVALAYGQWDWPTRAPLLPLPIVERPGSNEKCITVPAKVTPELAFLLGAYVSEGHTSASNWTIVITNSVDSVLERVRTAWSSEFGLTARIARPRNRCPAVVVASKRAVRVLEALAVGSRARTKRVPGVVLNGTRENALAFLQGLALDAYVVSGNAPKWALCVDSPGLVDDVQVLLTRCGYVSNRISKFNSTVGKAFDEVYVAGEQAQQLLVEVPFLEPAKAARAAILQGRRLAQSTSDIVPLINGLDLYELIPPGRPGRNGRGTSRAGWAFLRDPRTKHVSRRTLERVAASGLVSLPADLRRVLAENLHFSPVVGHIARSGADSLSARRNRHEELPETSRDR